MLGAIGSTDNHFGTAGDVSESGFFGGIAMLWQDDATRLTAPVFNPGGLVAVWAEQNTRASIFDALQRREAYATSGPRITVRFGVANEDYCGSNDVSFATTMGGVLGSHSTPVFTVMAAQDQTRLAAVEIVKGVLVNGAVQERVVRIANFESGKQTACVTWRDDAFETTSPAYWYARILEQPTPRWSKLLCERSNDCDQYPAADRMIQERAWTSPIWNLPGTP